MLLGDIFESPMHFQLDDNITGYFLSRKMASLFIYVYLCGLTRISYLQMLKHFLSSLSCQF